MSEVREVGFSYLDLLSYTEIQHDLETRKIGQSSAKGMTRGIPVYRNEQAYLFTSAWNGDSFDLAISSLDTVTLSTASISDASQDLYSFSAEEQQFPLVLGLCWDY